MQNFVQCQIKRIYQIPLSVLKETIGIVFVLNGKCSVKQFSSVKEYREGDVFFLNPCEVYAITSASGCVVEWVEFDASCLNQPEFQHLSHMQLIDSVGSLDQEKDMAEVYRDCVFTRNLLNLALSRDKESSFQEVCDALVCDYHVLSHPNVQSSVMNEAQMDWVFQIYGMIQKNLNEKITLQHLADEMGMQKNYFATQFKNCTGMTVLECVNQYRLKKAEELLLFEGMSHSSIIKECGFSDSKYFYRYFLSEFSMTPMQWKEEMKCFDAENCEVLDEKEAGYWLHKMEDQLNGLKTDTEFYRQFTHLKELEKAGLVHKEMVLEIDLLHPSNYIEVAGERMNAWYGFDLMMNEIRKHEFTAELVIRLNAHTEQEELDELFRLLKKSASRFQSRVLRCWRFVIVIEDVRQASLMKQLRKRLENEFENLDYRERFR